MELKELNLEDVEKEYEFLKELKTENGFENPYENVKREGFENCLKYRIEASKNINLPDGYVPETYFFLWDSNRIVALFKVRHYLNDFLKNGAGHIGYGVLEEYRQSGYGKTGLKLAVDKLKQMPDFEGDEVYLSCNKNNVASLKTMLACGGYIHHEDEKEYYVRIKV